MLLIRRTRMRLHFPAATAPSAGCICWLLPPSEFQSHLHARIAQGIGRRSVLHGARHHHAADAQGRHRLRSGAGVAARIVIRPAATPATCTANTPGYWPIYAPLKNAD